MPQRLHAAGTRLGRAAGGLACAAQFVGAVGRFVLRWQLNLNLFQYAFSFLTLVLPSVIIAKDVLSGDLEVGRAIQAAGAFTAILSALTVVIDHFEGLSRLRRRRRPAPRLFDAVARRARRW